MGKSYLPFEKVKSFLKKRAEKNKQKMPVLASFRQKSGKLYLPPVFLRKRGRFFQRIVCKLFEKSVLKNREFEGEKGNFCESFQDCSLLTKEQFCGMLYISKWGNSAQKREWRAECPDFFGF